MLSDQQIKEIIQQNVVIANATNRLMESAEFASDERGDNMSAIGLQWGDRQQNGDTVSTQLMPLGETTTIMNTVQQHMNEEINLNDLSDDDIEHTIAEIQTALNKTQQKPKI